jgi:glycosyltransferase involved in cell wall biosynthesis
MKKVLIIANLFHASPRIPGIASYLSEYEWHATIVTPPLGDDFAKMYAPPQNFFKSTKIIEVPYRGDVLWLWRILFKKVLKIKNSKSVTESLKEDLGMSGKNTFINKMLKFYQSLFGYPDTEKNWMRPVFKTLIPLLKDEKYDAILSTSPYPTSHIIAEKISRIYSIPWAADFRDCWSQNFAYPYGNFRKFFDTRIEKKILKTAKILTAATPSVAETQKTLTGKDTALITNGFDPTLLSLPMVPIEKKFTITYTGRIYTGKQDPLKFLFAIRDLIENKKIDPKMVTVRFFGETLFWFKEEVKKMGLESVVQFYGIIPREEIFKKQKESHLLLLFSWEDATEMGVYPKKTFEYLAAQRPIIVTGGKKEEKIKEIIAETETGTSAITHEEIKEKILSFYREYEKTGTVEFHGNKEKILLYSFMETAKQFSDIFEKIAP